MPAKARTHSKHALADADYKLLADFRHVLRQFLAFSEERASELGLASQQHQALLAIKGVAPATPSIGDLAQRLVIKPNSAVGLVNRLVRSGFVTRRLDDADHRKASLVLTRKGEAILAELTVAHRNEVRRISPLLDVLLRQLGD